MNKGIVMEMTDKSIIVMRQDGKFDKISRKNRSCEVGEEIIYADSRIDWRSPSVAGRSALVAAVVFCLVVFASFAGKLGGSEVVAYVSLDINPSVEMGIDEKEQVLELRGLNEDGTSLIQEVNFKGKSLENVTAALLDKAERNALAKGEATIVIASSAVTEQSAVDDTQIADKLRKQVTEHIKQTHPDQTGSYQVEAFAAPQEVREEANKSNVSMGKYSVYLNAKSNGIDVKIDDLKKESIQQLVKNNPDSKAAIMQPEKTPTKSDIRKWIEEEKSGELDKKLQEKKKEQTSKDSSKSNETNKNDPKKPGTGGKPGNTNTGGSKKDDKDDKNSKNGKNDKDGKNDDKDDDDRKDNKNNKKPPSTLKPSPTPTPPGNKPGTVTPTPKPGTPAPGMTRPGSTAKPPDRDDDKKKDEDKKDDDKKNDDRKATAPPPKKDDGKKDDDRKRAEEEAKRVEEQKKQAEKKKEEEHKKEEERKKEQTKKEQEKKEQEKKEQDKKDNGKKDSDNRKGASDDDDENNRRR